METKKIGYIGFGEVGRAFSHEMKTKGAEVYYSEFMEIQLPQGILF